jgi:rod shape-determining protein MreD
MIKKILINFLIIGILIALNLSDLIRFLKVKDVLPDLILIFTVLNGFFYGPIFGMIFGFSCGMAYEISSKFPVIGLYALIYTVIGYSTSISKTVYIDNTFTSTIAIFLFMILKAFLFIILVFLFMNTDFLVNYFMNIYWIELIYTLLLSIPIFLIFKKFNFGERKTRIDG